MKDKMKFLIIGLILGLSLGGGIAWATARYCIIDNNGKILGASSGAPLYITTN